MATMKHRVNILRDLIRRDMEQKESEKWERVRSSLAEGFSFSNDKYQPIDRDAFKKRNRARRGID